MLKSKIGEDAFKGCSSLQSVSIPDSVTKIGHGAFEGCSKLKAISKLNGGILRAYLKLRSIFKPNSGASIGDASEHISSDKNVNDEVQNDTSSPKSDDDAPPAM